MCKSSFIWLTAMASALLGVSGPCHLGVEESTVGVGGVGVGEVVNRQVERC